MGMQGDIFLGLDGAFPQASLVNDTGTNASDAKLILTLSPERPGVRRLVHRAG
jgi:hypothetical protein